MYFAEAFKAEKRGRIEGKQQKQSVIEKWHNGSKRTEVETQVASRQVFASWQFLFVVFIQRYVSLSQQEKLFQSVFKSFFRTLYLIHSLITIYRSREYRNSHGISILSVQILNVVSFVYSSRFPGKPVICDTWILITKKVRNPGHGNLQQEYWTVRGFGVSWVS